jgi:hypothetical protein
MNNEMLHYMMNHGRLFVLSGVIAKSATDHVLQQPKCLMDHAREDEATTVGTATVIHLTTTALQVFWGGTLFHVDDLPFKLSSMPPNYSDFRQALRGRDVRQPVEAPAQIKGLPAAT